jgi:hypothetical protein
MARFVITPEHAIACRIKPSAIKACADWNEQAARSRGKATTDADRQRYRAQATALSYVARTLRAGL